jgi:hypothetical protein
VEKFMRTLRLLFVLVFIAPDISFAQRLATDTARVCVPIRAGWNILSNPVLRATGLDSICVVYPGADPCCSFWPFPGYLQWVCTLTNGRAAFLRFTGARVICVNGEPLTSLTVQLVAGWNLIGSISYPVPVSAISTSPPGILSSRFFAYAGRYVGTDTIQPGQGYWIKASQAGQVNLVAPPGVSRGGL